MSARWQLRQTDADLTLMSETLGVSEIIARILANRGVRTKNTAQAFLRPREAPLRDPLLLKGAPEAIARIAQALAQDEKIVVYGDYDVDGIMSTVIMYRVLTRLGGDVSYYMPHRVEEGYGLNMGAVEWLASGSTRLLICVDNGISAVEEIAAARAGGIDIVIIDHHEAGGELPDANAIVDPKQPDCTYPFKEMCAAALVYKICAALCAAVGTAFREEAEMCALAAMACICDIVELVDENRTLVHRGLAVLNHNKLINPGLGALITLRGYLDKTIDTHTIGFVLGPCLNATGRLETAELSVDLLLAEDVTSQASLARDLVALNDSRKDLTKECVDRALAALGMGTAAGADTEPAALPKVIVHVDPLAHESVAGIVAGRIRDITHRPVIVLTHGEDAVKGSGRSIPAYNLFEAMYAHRQLFLRFGGHAAAAGMTLPEENIAPLRAALNADCTLTDEDFLPVLEIDAQLNADDITLELSRELAVLAPFGKGNPAPLFVTHDLRVEAVRSIPEKNTLIFTFKTPSGRRVKGIAFGMNEQYARACATAGVSESGGYAISVTYRIETNIYNGIISVQVGVRDFIIPVP